MSTPRYSREDYEGARDHISAILDHTLTGSLAYADPLRLRLWRAMMDEAANRAPTHEDLNEGREK